MTERERYALSAKDAAGYVGIALITLYKLAEAGKIDHLRTSENVYTRVVKGQRRTYRKHGRLKFSYAGLDAWIAERRVTVKAPRPAAVDARSRSTMPMPARRHFA